jgi:hypothetical protein
MQRVVEALAAAAPVYFDSALNISAATMAEL